MAIRTGSKVIAFRATTAERRQISAKIRQSGLSQQKYLLNAALGQPIHVMTELKPLLSELRARGRNLNQLTVLAHEGRIQDAMASVIHLIHLWTLLNKFPFIIKSEKGRNIFLNVPALLLFLFCLALLLRSFPVSKLPPPFLILKNIYISGSRTLGRRRTSQTIQCYVIPHLQHN